MGSRNIIFKVSICIIIIYTFFNHCCRLDGGREGYASFLLNFFITPSTRDVSLTFLLQLFSSPLDSIVKLIRMRTVKFPPAIAATSQSLPMTHVANTTLLKLDQFHSPSNSQQPLLSLILMLIEKRVFVNQIISNMTFNLTISLILGANKLLNGIIMARN